MDCANCGAPISPSRDAEQPLTCAYCGTVAQPVPPANTVGALVDQLLAQVEPAGRRCRPGAIKSAVVIQQASYSVNGQAYSSVDQMPPAARRALEEGLAMVQGPLPSAPQPASNPRPGNPRVPWVLLAIAVGLLLLVLFGVVAFWVVGRG